MNTTINDTEFDVLCQDCQRAIDLDVPQFHGQPLFQGDFEERSCGRCGDSVDRGAR